MTLDGEDLALFERSLRGAAERHSGPALDAALGELGWSDALAADERAAIGLLFDAQGEHDATSSALERVLLHGLHHDDAGIRVALPAVGQWQPPGQLEGQRLRVRGLVGGGLARLATAHQLIGASRTMLALAREHALERIQFGAPIASFQAVRHRLAETLVAIETASALVDGAWLDGSEITATMAKATAGREARVAARHCQQVLAGIGFTTEHDLHRYVRRVLVLDGLFGSSKGLAKAVGDRLVSSRQLPPLLPL